MPNKKITSETPLPPFEETFEEPVEGKEVIQPIEAVPAEELLYNEVEWKSGIMVYQCSNCKLCLNHEDDMILHVVSHFPIDQRNKILDSLIKEK